MPSQMTSTLEASKCLAIHFGEGGVCCRQGPEGIELNLPVPVLAGPARETIAFGTVGDLAPSASRHGPFEVLSHGGVVAGAAVCSIDGDLEAKTYWCYRELFNLLGDEQHAYRVWHYVPGINQRTDGLENYCLFNVGRRRAFDDHFGKLAESQMPAASAVGMPHGHFAMAFVGGTRRPRFLENPKQTPAYRYPQSYGPKSPSFARAAIAGEMVYVSGTASIQGHATVHQDDLQSQFDVTVDNLEQLAPALGFPSWNAVSKRPDYALKVYLRHATDLHRIQPRLEERLRATAENTTILNTDICRADLDLEIEAVFSKG